jgi:uncharacterized SAM-binding protein YcdF (DUF218 family)
MPADLQLFLSKLLPLIVLPEGLLSSALIAVFVSAYRRSWRGASVSAALAFGIYVTSASPITAHWLMGSLERQHPADPASLPRADVAIVLGGAVHAPSRPRREPELGDAVDRVWYAAQLYRSGSVKRILVVGGSLPWWPHGRPEAELIRAMLVDLGVPATAIDIGATSRNTYENAVEAKALMQKRPFTSGLLVTSAWHMPRALAIFTKAGIPVVPAPCDFRASDTLSGTLLDWVPQADAFAMTSAALREWMGFYVYRWRGWL